MGKVNLSGRSIVEPQEYFIASGNPGFGYARHIHQ
jgi:hypothetical protein